MIGFEEALALVEANRWAPPSESVPIAQARGRVLARAVEANRPSPAFDQSAMDGYAVGSGGVGPWRVVGEVAAGASWPSPVGSDEAVRIFTGAMVPNGTWGILPQEEVRIEGTDLQAETPVPHGAHVRHAGEEFTSGTMLLQAGTRLSPGAVGGLASQGFAAVEVAVRPRVRVLGTGSELVPPGGPIAAGQVYESNTYAVAGALEAMGCQVEANCVADEAADVVREVRAAVEGSDLLVTIGGVSVGDYDLVRPAVAEAGVDLVFAGVAIKPGKPLAFGRVAGGAAWFGLPGNPLSAMVGVALFVSTWLGLGPRFVALPSAGSWTRRPGREEFVPARLEEGPCGYRVRALPQVGSHSTLGLAYADGLARVEGDRCSIEEDEPVAFAPLPWTEGGR